MANAQDYVDLAGAYLRYAPMAQKKNYPEQYRTIQHVALEAKVPFILKNKNVFFIGTESSHMTLFNRIDMPNGGDIIIPDEYAFVNLQFGYQHNWNEKWQSTFVLVPKFISDMPTLFDGNHFQFGGVLLVNCKQSENLTWRMGVYANKEFFGPLLSPSLGFYWKVNDKLQFDVNMMNRAFLYYRAHDRFWTGVGFRGGINSYGLSEEDVYLEKVDNNIFVFTDVFVTKNLVLNLRAGHSILRTYRYFPEDEKVDMKLALVNFGGNRTKYDGDIKDGLMFEVRLIFRYWLSKEEPISKDLN